MTMPSDSPASGQHVTPAAKASAEIAQSKRFNRFRPRLPKDVSKPLALGAAILLGGGAIAALNFAQRAPRSLAPTGAQFVPQSALGTMTVTTDELTWTKLRQFGTPETQAQFDTLLKQWKDQLFSANGYSFKRDIKPWIGDRVTVALLSGAETDTEAPTESTALQSLVLVVPIDDPLKAKSLMRDEEKALEGSDRTYKGVDIKALDTGDTNIQTALIGTNWLLLSNSEQGIEQAIDTHKGARSLLNVPGYRKAATRAQSPQPPGKNFAQIYLNIPNLTRSLQPAAGNTSRASVIPLQGSQGLVATALVESEGIRFEGTSWLLPKNDLAYSDLSNEADEMPRKLPDDTLIMMSGSNFQQFWQGFKASNTSPPFFPNPQNLEAGLLTQTGLDLEEDVLPWAAGEFTLGVLPPELGPTDAEENEPDVDESDAESGIVEPGIENAPLVMMVQTNDRQLAESAWQQLDEVMASRYRYEVTTEDLDGGSVTRWVSPFEGVQFSHGWLPGNVTFFAVGAGAADVIAPSPRQTLAETREFQTLTGKAPQPNNGHFYLDLAQINALEGTVFPLPELPEEGTTTAIEAIGLTSTVSDRTMDYDLYIKLSKGNRPGPL